MDTAARPRYYNGSRAFTVVDDRRQDDCGRRGDGQVERAAEEEVVEERGEYDRAREREVLDDRVAVAQRKADEHAAQRAERRRHPREGRPAQARAPAGCQGYTPIGVRAFGSGLRVWVRAGVGVGVKVGCCGCRGEG